MAVKILSIAMSYIIGYIYVLNIFSFNNNGLWGIIFLFGFIIWIECLYRYNNKTFSVKEEAEAYFFLICLLVINLSVNLNVGIINSQPGLPLTFSQLMSHCIAVYWVITRFKLTVEGATGDYFLIDFFKGLIKYPFKFWFSRMKFLYAGVATLCKKIRRNDRDSKQSLPTILVIVGAFLLLIIVVGILGSTDENFAKIFSFSVPKPDIEILVYFVLSLPVGCYLFGLVYAGYNNRNCQQNVDAVKSGIEKLRTVGTVTLTVILVIFSFVYAIYIGLQISYFIGGFFGELPDNFTYAQYARRGFFELCIIMGINLCILTAVAKLSINPIRKQKTLKTTGIIFLIICMFFAITALSKLLLYIDAYGFTALRLLSGWSIFVLITATILAGISTIKPIKAVRYLVIYIVLSYAVVCLI